MDTVEATKQGLERLEANLEMLGRYGVDLTGVRLCLDDSQLPKTEKFTLIRTIDTTAGYLANGPDPITPQEAQHRLNGVSQMCLYGVARVHRQN